jgi:uncharacterized protein with FMN-binding domain
MRRITLAVVATAAVLVLLFSYRTSTSGPLAASSSVSRAHVVSGSGSSGATPAAASGRPPSALAGTVVVDGTAEATRYGPVQVEVSIADGKITAVKAIQYPTDTRLDQEINNQAIPELASQVLSAQSAHIDGVSGATYTTEGYVTSLQSALDAANFK